MKSKIITIAQQKGGAGKTTIAAHLAVAYSQKGKRVAAIDIDPQGSFSMWYNIREQKFGEGFTGINFSSITGLRVNSEISRLREEHDIIIIDSPPHTETEAKSAIRAADLVIIPMQPSPTDLWASKATIELAIKERKNIGVLLNRCAANSKLAKELISDMPYLLKNTLGNRVAYVSCLMEGRCVTESEPGSAASQEIKSIIKEIDSKFFSQVKMKDKELV
jgi:chromosome partitioning protein